MHYNYYLELCSLIFLVAITVAYFSRKKFPVPIFKLFGVCLLVVVFDVSMDIFSCVLLDNSNNIPLIYCEIVTELFYAAQLLTSYLLFAYVFYSVGKSLKYSPIYNLTIVPSGIMAILIFTNAFHHQLFSFVPDENGIYDFDHGILFTILCIVVGLNVLATVIFTLLYRRVLLGKMISTLFCIIGIIASANIIQLFQPHYLLSGVGFTLAMIFAIVSVNDPDEKVDRISKAFNNDAFIDYINTQREEKQRKYYIVFDIESFGMINEGVNKKTYIFKTQSSRFVLLMRNKEEQMDMVAAIKTRFSLPFYVKQNSINISIRLFYFFNDNAFKNSDSYNYFINRTIATINFVENPYVELDKEYMDSINRDRRIKEILQDSLEKKENLHMVYQPIYDIQKKCFDHYEALLRLDNDELGYVGPTEFIPIAESFGLANAIDSFVLNETCAFLKRNPQIDSLEINVSCAEFFNNPSERFIKTIKKYDIDPNRVCLEITETVATKYPEKTKQFMKDLSQYGVKFAMDDFGSGYSNIARFITLPFSLAKLDKSLLSEKKNVRIFLDSAIHLFKNLDIPIVIEGIETEEQLKLAKNKEIDFVQGYYFSKPLPEAELLEFIKK